MANEKVQSNRTSEETKADARQVFIVHVRDSVVMLKEKENTGGSRRDFLVRTGKILSVVIGGGIVSEALSANLGESDVATDSPEIPSTVESTDSEPRNDPTDDDPFWYARDLMGLID